MALMFRAGAIPRCFLPLFVAIVCLLPASNRASAEELNPLSLTKYMDALPIPGVMPQAAPNHYEIGAFEIQQRLHAQLPLTTVYGYGGSAATASYPGPTIVAQKGVPITIKWTNFLPPSHILDYAYDPTIPRAATSTGVPISTHVHGAEVEPESDGGPFSWFTAAFAETGPTFTKQVKSYANSQLPATIWYHDHAWGYTRHNVYAGLAGYYLLTDPGHEPAGLPAAPYDMGICIQDRMFTTDGQLWYPNEGETEVHPIWIPEFFGDVILVNGKVWPYLEVEPRKYRFRFLNGAQARFFSLALADRVTGAAGPAFHQIASDGGYLSAPVVLNDPATPRSPRLLMAPGERCEVVVDFSAYAPGSELLLKNNAKAPFPSGETPNPQTVGQIMLFRVVPLQGVDASVIPAQLTTVRRLANPTRTRVMTLNETMVEDGPTGALLNGMPYEAGATEFPTLGSTEMWEIVNMTRDAHPIHVHLVQFQLLNRQKYNMRRYASEFMTANPSLPAETYVPVDVSRFLIGKPVPPDPNEMGWKDTFRMNPGEVTRILLRFAPQDDTPAFAFDATAEPGYVWHCHILEHEENDMMRPFHLVAPGAAPLADASRAVGTTAAVIPEPGFTAMPNPVAGAATLRFALASAGNVDIDLYNVAGQRVRHLVHGWYEPGEHSFVWQRSTDAAGNLPSGVYFLKLRAGDATRLEKLVLAP
jgi:FtsP/CotA-like multicopper oxidase with cupredoxin domain